MLGKVEPRRKSRRCGAGRAHSLKKGRVKRSSMITHVDRWPRSAFAPIYADFLADRQVRNLGRLRRVDRQMEQATMDENRVEGTAHNLGGKAQEGFGKVTGNARAQAEGLANQAAGAAQDLYGQAADTARETASGFEKALRHTIETQPFTSALVALGIGWFLGRMHRPL